MFLRIQDPKIPVFSRTGRNATAQLIQNGANFSHTHITMIVGLTFRISENDEHTLAYEAYS